MEGLDFELKLVRDAVPRVEYWAGQLPVHDAPEVERAPYTLVIPGSPQDMYRAGRVNGFARMLKNIYFEMLHDLAWTLGYHDIVGEFPEDCQPGVLWRFGRTAQHYLYRLQGYHDRVAHLSNAFHNLGLERKPRKGEILAGAHPTLQEELKRVTAREVKGCWRKLRLDDAFVRSVEAFCGSPSIEKALELRNGATHNFELDTIGIGCPMPQMWEHPKFVRVSFGARAGSVKPDELAALLRDTWSEVTKLHKAIFEILLQDTEAPGGNGPAG